MLKKFKQKIRTLENYNETAKDYIIELQSKLIRKYEEEKTMGKKLDKIEKKVNRNNEILEKRGNKNVRNKS